MSDSRPGNARENRPLTARIRPDAGPMWIDEYESAGGYRALRKALEHMAPKEVQSEVKDSGLMGRGGAGFPTGVKWSFTPVGDKARHPKYFIANADEMEPGAFKDRYLLEGDPHQLVESLAISAYAVEADVAYIFLRNHYTLARRRLERAIAEAYERGYLGAKMMGSDYSLEMRIHVSAGRYICGEETALISALEGDRPIPRAKPPFPGASGLFGQPTVVNNVETVCNVAHIIENGAQWFKDLSLTDQAGSKVYAVSGRVKCPGCFELPMGTPIREILDHAGGMADGYRFRGVLPGGGSTDFLVEEHLDLAMDYATIGKAGSRLGTGTLIVLDDRTCPVGFVANLMKFFGQESCGWCTPCREGLPWLARLLYAMERGEAEPRTLEILDQQTQRIAMGRTYCALAPGAMEPLQSALKYFRDDFVAHIETKRCSWREQ